MPTDSLAGGKGVCQLAPVKLRVCRMSGGVRLEIHKASMVPTDALLAGASHIYISRCAWKWTYITHQYRHLCVSELLIIR